MPLLTDAAVRALINVDLAVETIERVYAEYGRARRVLSAPPALLLPESIQGQAAFKVKGARLNSLGVGGFRMIADRTANGAEETIDFCWVADSETGRVVGLVDETWLHRLRTALTGVVAARYLSRKPTRVISIIGAGKIADELPAALTKSFMPDEIRVVARRKESAESFARRHDSVANIKPFIDAEKGVDAADLVICISSAESPVLKAAYLSAGATVCGMGGGAEIDVDVLDRADKFVADDLEYALTIGSVRGWLDAGRTRSSISGRLDADLGEIAIGAKPGRTDDRAIVLVIVQGMACCDLALARLALVRAGLMSGKL